MEIHSMEAQPWTSKDMQDATNFCIWQCDAMFGFASLHFKVWHSLDKVSVYFDMDSQRWTRKQHPKQTVTPQKSRGKKPKQNTAKPPVLLCLLLSEFSKALGTKDYRGRLQVMVAVLQVISSVQNTVSTYGTQMQIWNIFEVILNLTNG